ncbi:MAG: T9SS type A sorting domain-containing protein [Candidatus Eisenbacteria bacterium]|nr:T9SS type A sorting domain-containing protein [Candidatus Eisenbacteria bacterium]
MHESQRNHIAIRVLLTLAVFAAAILWCGAAWAIPDRYHTYDEVHTEILALEANYPSIVRVDTLGVSSEDGMDIWGVKLSDNVDTDEDEPVVFYNGIHHAEEVMGLEVIMWMLDELTTNYGVNDTMTAWVDDFELYFIPLLNPEGHAVVTADVDTTWRKNKRDNNENGEFDLDYDGVDFNHNYDFNWALGGSDNPPSDYYRGPAPFSENGTQIVRDFCLEHKPLFALNYHSPRSSDGDLVYYPWYWMGYGFAPDHYVIFDVASELCNRTLDEADEPYEPVYGFADRGKARNWQYGVVGSIGYTMEILSYLCIPGGHRVDGICERVSNGSYYLIERSYGPGITGHVTASDTRAPIVAEVKVLENHSDQLSPRTTDPTYGRYWRLLLPGTYTVEFSAFGYETQTFTDVVVDSSGYTTLDCELEPWTGVPEDDLGTRIERVSPNPFRDATTLSFAAPRGESADVVLYNASGRVVREFSVSPAGGSGTVVWDGTDSSGRPVASGVYFAELTSGGASDRSSIVLLR